MTNFIKKTLITFTILPAILLANEASTSTVASNSKKEHTLAIYHTVVGDIEEKYNTMVETKLKSIGFNLTDPHKRVNDQYEAKWGSTVLDVLSFMPIVRDRTVLPLLNIDPRIAGFAPFNLVIHKKLDENVSYVGHLVPETMLDILGISNQEVRKKFSAPFKALDATIAQELGGDVRTIPYKALPEKTMINYEYEFEAPDDMDDFLDEFQNTFELAFINKGYLIAGYHNFMEATPDAEEILSDYDAFWTYSLCHLEFSYNMFDTQGARPEAGLFAPCTMYMYIRKGTNKLVVGMFRLHNWSATLNIKSKKRLDLINKLDTEIPAILEGLGMKSVPNVNPLLAEKKTSATSEKTVTPKEKVPAAVAVVPSKIKETKKAVPTKQPDTKGANIEKIKVGNETLTIAIPQVPKVIKCNSTTYNAGSDRSIKFSKRIPPNYRPHSFDRAQKAKTSTHTRIGEVSNGKISAYLRGKFMTVDEAKEKLKTAGFEIITAAPVNKKGDLISIVFTDKSLIHMASKENRGFMASLRLLVDTKEKTISITNPLYLAKGFLQNDFDETSANKILVRLLTHFTDLSNSKDALKFQLLPKYQFMKGMPHFQDMVEVASGKGLLDKIKNNKRVVFTQTLENGATLIGIKLSKRTRKFTKRIGRNNAAMLPYPILIENDKAKILDPKYYISIMYPLLTMSEFMTIATVPDAMLKDCEKVFK
ncbi:MAG TPA: hypothetical protein ENK39_08405 [Epsilonproteobacteria bacterium]|nr:hypothetical protein [Campylobacterota bacterium]